MARKTVFTAAISRSQHKKLQVLFSKTGYHLQHHESICTHWKKQGSVSDEMSCEEFLIEVEKGRRYMVTPFNTSTIISVRFRFCWILYLSHMVLKHHVGNVDGCTFHIKFFFWYDGGEIKSKNGLGVAIKIADVALYRNGEYIKIPLFIEMLFKARVWIISSIERSETAANVKEIEEMLLAGLKKLLNSDISYKGLQLVVEYLGFTADHGIRSKSLLRINFSSGRCGECSWLFSKLIEYGCLDWGTLIECEVILFNNWNAHRHSPMPSTIRELSGLSVLGSLCYDNLHCCGGHTKDVAKLLISLLSECDREEVYSKLYDLTKVKICSDESNPFKYFKYYHWRLISLKFDEIFLEYCSNTQKHKELSVLLELLNEIHLFNYINWNRRNPDFEVMRLRYALILFMYTYQLKLVFTSEQVQNYLDNIYLHKILLHSLVIFLHVNIASSSCEKGESLIACLDILYKLTNCKLDEGTVRILLFHILREEDAFLSNFTLNPRRKSQAFVDSFVDTYSPKKLQLLIHSSHWTTFEKFLSTIAGFPEDPQGNSTAMGYLDHKIIRRVGRLTNSITCKVDDHRIMRLMLTESSLRVNVELPTREDIPSCMEVDASINEFIYSGELMESISDLGNFCEPEPPDTSYLFCDSPPIRSASSIEEQFNAITLPNTVLDLGGIISKLYASSTYSQEDILAIASKIICYSPDPDKRGVLILQESHDGHCAYHSLSNQFRCILGKNHGHKDIRKCATEFLRNHFDDYCQFCEGGASELYHLLKNNETAQNEENTTEWADHLTLTAVTIIYEVNIHVLNSKILDWLVIKPENLDSQRNVYLLHWDQLHYDTILFKNNIQDKQLFKNFSEQRNTRGTGGNSSI